jgi:hypothetical protein
MSLAYRLSNLTHQTAAIRQALNPFDHTPRPNGGQMAKELVGGMDRYGRRGAWSGKSCVRVTIMGVC